MPTRTATTLPYTPSFAAPNMFDNARQPITMVVLHTIVGTIAAADAHFKNANRTSRSSAHYGIGFNGAITMWVPEDKNAFHAGNYGVNQKSIGIEHEDNGNPYDERPESLYNASAALVRDICTFYGIPIDSDHIVKHSAVSLTPTACPAGLDVDRIIKLAAGLPATQPTATVGQPMQTDTLTYANLVTKARNFDEVAKYFSLNDDQLKSAEAYKFIIQYIQTKQTELYDIISKKQTTINGLEDIIKMKQDRIDKLTMQPPQEAVTPPSGATSVNTPVSASTSTTPYPPLETPKPSFDVINQPNTFLETDIFAWLKAVINAIF